MEGLFAGPIWDLLLVVLGAVLGFVLQILAAGRGSKATTPPPLRLSQLPVVTALSVKASARASAQAEAKVVIRSESRSDGNEIWLWVIGAVVGALLFAAAYLEARHAIAASLRVLALVGLGFWLGTYGFLLRRNVVVGYGWAFATAMAAAVFLLAPVVISALADPTYVAGRSYSDLLASYDSCGIAGLSHFDGLRGATFVAAQLFGVGMYVIAWAAAATLLVVCLALQAVRLGHRPRRVWTRLARVPGPWSEHPILVVLGSLVIGLVALAFAGGAAQRMYADIGALDNQPELSQVDTTLDDGLVRLMVRSDFPATVTMRIRRAGKTVRTVRRHAVRGVNRWTFGRSDGSRWPNGTYALRLIARDAHGGSAEPLSVRIPGQHPARAACERKSAAEGRVRRLRHSSARPATTGPKGGPVQRNSIAPRSRIPSQLPSLQLVNTVRIGWGPGRSQVQDPVSPM